MDYIKNFEEFEWNKHDSRVFESCLNQVVFTVAAAYKSIGFVHNDFHAKNILIRKTRKSNKKYTIDGRTYTVPVYGYETLVMDLELSKVQQSRGFFYKDMAELFQKIRQRMQPPFSTNDLMTYITKSGNLELDGRYIDPVTLIPYLPGNKNF